MSNKRRIGDIGSTSGQEIKLLHVQPKVRILIRCENDEGMTDIFDVSLSDTVLTLKQMIADKLEVPIERQKIISYSHVLADKSKLADHRIVRGSIIELIHKW